MYMCAFNWRDAKSCGEGENVFFQTDAQQEARSYLSEEMLAGEYKLF